jgi:hypothetical protein
LPLNEALGILIILELGVKLERAITNQLVQLKRTLISQVDFKNCYGIAKHIVDGKLHKLDIYSNRYLLEGMSVGMVVAYCRPFSGNNGGNLSDKIFNALSEAEKEIHTQALALRNQTLAHSDADDWDMNPHYIEMDNNDRILMPFHNCVHDPVSLAFTKKLMELAQKQFKQCVELQITLEKSVGEHIPIFDINA